MAVAQPGHHPWPGSCCWGLWDGAALGGRAEPPSALCSPNGCHLLLVCPSWDTSQGEHQGTNLNSSQHITTSTTGQLLPIHTSLHGAGVQPYKIYLFPHGTRKQEEILIHK